MVKNGAPIFRCGWRLPLVFYYFLSGSSSGLFLHIFWDHIVIKNPSADRTTFYINFLPAIMTLIGLASLACKKESALEAAFPTDNQKRLGFVIEVLLGLVFMGLVNWYLFSNAKFVAVGAGLTAILYILYQGLNLFPVRSIEAFRLNIFPILFFTSGISTGYGVWIILRLNPRGLPGNLWIQWGAFVVLMNLAAWGYVIWVNKPLFSSKVLKTVRRNATLIAVLDGGIPVLAVIGIYFSGLTVEMSKTFVTRLGNCCGISLCLGGWVKFYLVLKDFAVNRI
jgi:formate-dependent nitrite reductase membrane component NrfD